MQRRYICLAAVVLCLTLPARARAQFGGSQIARQLQQLQQETATVTNLAQQLQYAIKNTTGGGAVVWKSNQNLLTNLGDLINQQEGLSYTFQGLTQQFQQLYPGYNAASTAGVQSPQVTVETTLDTLNGALASAQAQAQNFQAEQATLQNLELKNQTAIGNLQAVQVSAAGSATSATRDGRNELAECRSRESGERAGAKQFGCSGRTLCSRSFQLSRYSQRQNRRAADATIR